MNLVIVNPSAYTEYLRPLLVYSVKQIHFFKGVGAQFDGIEKQIFYEYLSKILKK